MATNQLGLNEAAASGQVIRDYREVSGQQVLLHLASAHNSVAIMDRATGELVLQRDQQEVMRTNIMSITALTALTPAARFTELVDSFAT